MFNCYFKCINNDLIVTGYKESKFLKTNATYNQKYNNLYNFFII